MTVYHLDGDNLVATHYCAMGNQPKMKAKQSRSSEKIVFECQGGTNMKSENDSHIHGGTLTVVDKDRLNAVWHHFVDGKSAGDNEFVLVRKKK